MVSMKWEKIHIPYLEAHIVKMENLFKPIYRLKVILIKWVTENSRVGKSKIYPFIIRMNKLENCQNPVTQNLEI